MGKDKVGHPDLLGGEQTDLHSHSIYFLDHVDTPLDYAESAGKFVKVNAIPDGLIFTGLSAGDLPAHSHVRANISDFWDEPFWASILDKPSTFLPSAHTLASHSSKAHSELSDAPADAHHPQTHTLASHTLKDHHLLAGLGDDDHSQYYNAGRHTKAVHDALGINAATVGTLVASAFIRANADDNVFGHTEWQDGFQARFGAGADFRIWHAAPHHYMRSYKHGENLYIQLEDAGGTNRTLATFDPDAKGLIVGDHGSAATDMTVNVCYGTGNPPTANTTTIGTLFVKY